VYVPAVWKLIIPPRVQFFLWLMSKDKILTRDSLGRRRRLDDQTCLFCGEESVAHLFFGCVVARRAWEVLSAVLGVQVGYNFESVAKLWLCNKKFGMCNVFTSAVCWSIWKLRNSLCFQGESWSSMKTLWRRVVPMIRSWRVLTPLKLADGFDSSLTSLEAAVWAPEKIQWRPLLADAGGGLSWFPADDGG
jgi:hypothetical protein